MRNESYTEIDPATRYGRGLTELQQAWHANWEEGYPFFTGAQDRPLASVGFKLQPQPEFDRHRRLTGYAQPKLTPDSRWVWLAELDMVSLSWRPEDAGRRYTAKKIQYPLMVQGGWVHDGQVFFGGRADRLHRLADGSRRPLQDHQLFLAVDVRDGQLIYQGPPGEFVANHNGYCLDLCVGRFRGQPVVRYRFSWQDADDVVVTEAKRIKAGDVIATLSRDMRVGQAIFGERGEPQLDVIGGPILSASRQLSTLSMMVDMDQMLNQTALGYGDFPVTPLSDWFPRAYYVLDEAFAADLSAQPAYAVTEHLLREARLAIGPEGDYHIRAKHSGMLLGLSPCQAQPHLQLLEIGGAAQYVPVTATLLDGLETGCHVQAGQPIADVAPRFVYGAGDLRAVLDDNYDWFLADFLQSRMIRSGQRGWTGMGTLVDVRDVGQCLPNIDERHTILDLSTALPYLRMDGTIVGPPCAFPDPDEYTRHVNGVTIYLGAGSAPAPSKTAAKKAARHQGRKARAGKPANVAPAAAVAEGELVG